MDKNTVLIVDDEADIRDMLAVLLEEEGYQAAGAANGLEALNYLRQHRPLPCLVLLDLMMPVMDGSEFRRRQRADPALESIPVVVLTADGRPPSLDAAGYLIKPVRLRDLLDAVERHGAVVSRQ